MQARAFQMGLRIEHPQELVDDALYGKFSGHPALGAADYVLTARRGRPTTSFCVCPGGVVLPAVAETGTFCTNGMSRYRRDSGFCNGALIATVKPHEFGGTGPLAGLELQERCERAAGQVGGSAYAAPSQSAADFLRDVVRQPTVETTYPLGLRAARLVDLVPPAVASALRSALPLFDRKIPGFAGDRALLLGPEACASCPVQLSRDRSTRQSLSVAGLYPCGAGSGHAAGIMSSAVDGLLSAEALVERFRPPA